jgi:hypothetical protein
VHILWDRVPRGIVFVKDRARSARAPAQRCLSRELEVKSQKPHCAKALILLWLLAQSLFMKIWLEFYRPKFFPKLHFTFTVIVIQV